VTVLIDSGLIYLLCMTYSMHLMLSNNYTQSFHYSYFFAIYLEISICCEYTYKVEKQKNVTVQF